MDACWCVPTIVPDAQSVACPGLTIAQCMAVEFVGEMAATVAWERVSTCLSKPEPDGGGIRCCSGDSTPGVCMCTLEGSQLVGGPGAWECTQGMAVDVCNPATSAASTGVCPLYATQVEACE